MNDVLELVQSLTLSTLRVSTPLIFAAMGGLMSERSGVTNIALEGFMVAGAVTAASVAHFTHSPWLGAVIAIVAGALLAVIYAFSVIQMKTDQIVAGTAINFLAFGAAPLATKALFDSTGHTPALEMGSRFQYAPVVAAFLLVFLLHFWIRRTRTGLWQGFAGEHPEALSTAGISVRAVRWWSVAASGALAGLGGVALSIFLSSSFSRGMTAGRGFMALAALIFGKWKPVPTMLACLFFGLTDALQIRLQGVKLIGEEPIPVQFIQVLPYVVTVLVLAGFVGKSRAPAKLGTPWMLLAALGLGALGSSGCQPIARRPVPQSAAPQPQASLTPEQGNVLLLREMFEVVALAPKPTKEMFDPRAATVLQGASLEGVYNGFVHSREYRLAESNSGPANPKTVDAFARALASLQRRMKSPWRMPESMTKPPAAIQRPDGEKSDVKVGSGWKTHEQVLEAKDPEMLIRFYREAFSGASFYTLKRVLGAAILQAFDETKTLSSLYAGITLDWNEFPVDFGSSLRKEKDEGFHQEWAMKSTSDRIRWETLNRAHRILNAAELSARAGKEAPASTSSVK